MSKFNIRSTGNAVVAVALILAVLVRLPFADALLLHDHGDHGVHSHAVTQDDLRDGDVCAAWHRYHDDIHDEIHDGDRDDGNNDSDGRDSGGSEHPESLLIFVSDPARATGIHCSFSAVIASIQHPTSKVLPQSMRPGDSTGIARFMAASWPSAYPLRPAFALDALLQSSQALLL